MATRLLPFRESGNDRAVVFIHGINGQPWASWGRFPELLAADDRLAGWDILSFDYHEHSSVGFAQRQRTTFPAIAEMLAADLAETPRYGRLALIGHNAGGLIAQLAVLRNDRVAARLAHLFVFGPANGGIRLPLPKFFNPLVGPMMQLAGALMPVYDQLDELRPDSSLLASINAEWRHRFGEAAAFSQCWIAARHDRIALYEGLTYTDSSQRFIVDAPDHSSLIKPEDAQSETVRIVVRGLLDLSPPEAPREAAQGVASLALKIEEERFDVFLHCDSADREEVRELAGQLSQDGVRVWLEEDRVGRGQRLRKAHARDEDRIGALAICIGRAGAGRALRDEKELIEKYDQRGRPVIPIYLRSAPVPGDALREPLDEFTPLDLRSGDDLPALEAGIRGERPPRRPAPVPRTAPPGERRWRRTALLAGGAVVAIVMIAVPAYEWYLGSTSTPGSQTTPRNRPHYVRHSDAGRVLVFVHGIIGNAGDTWTNANGVYWPELIAADPDFNGTDVYVDQYDSGAGNRFRIDELANSMAERLQSNGVLDHAQIVFVTHSMGGLVTQRFLSLNRELGRKVPAFFLYATPQNGAQIATLLSTFSLDPVLRDMGDPDVYLKTILTDWRSARRGWEAEGVSVRRYCAYEKLALNGVVIVSEASGTTLCDDEPLAINANHVNIVKPGGRDDSSYTFLKNRWPKIPPPASGSAPITRAP